MSMKKVSRLNIDVFTNNFFKQLSHDTDFTDVTLACDDGQVVGAHKVVLASVSPFFKTILRKSSGHPNPLVHIQGAEIGQIRQMLKFIYLGSINIESDQLNSFLEAASRLKIDGLDKLNFEEDPDETLVGNQREAKDSPRESVIVGRFSKQQPLRSEQTPGNGSEKCEKQHEGILNENAETDVFDAAESRLENNWESMALASQLTSAARIEKTAENVADAILAEEERRLDIFREETLIQNDQGKVDQVSKTTAPAETSSGTPIETNVKLEDKRLDVEVEGDLEQDDRWLECEQMKESLLHSNEKVKVEGDEEKVDQEANDDQFSTKTGESFKQKEVKQELLENDAFTSQPNSSSNPVQNRRKKRSKGAAWSRRKKASPRNILKSNAESPADLQVNPYHKSISNENVKVETTNNETTADNSFQRESGTKRKIKAEAAPVVKKVRVGSLPPTRRSARVSVRDSKVRLHNFFLFSVFICFSLSGIQNN